MHSEYIPFSNTNMTQISAPAKSPSPWIKGPFTDVFVGAGGWSLPLIVGALFLANNYYATLSLSFYFLALFCNNPHYMATLYRAYGVKRDFNRYKFFSLYVSAIIALSGIAAHLSPKLIPLLFTVYLVWSPWHYTGQNFGISMMMLRRGGIAPSRLQRTLLYVSFLGSYLVWIVDLNTQKTQDALTLTVSIPQDLATGLRLLGYAAFIVCGLTSMLSLKAGKPLKSMLVPMVLLLSQFLWFLLPGILRDSLDQTFPATYFNAGILAFMHCAQYLWITSYYAKNETEQGLRGPNKTWRPWKYFGTLTLGGIALFVPGPWIVSTVFRHDLFESALIFIALINIHHFMLDGAIWKLRDGRIARLLLGSTPPATKNKSDSDTKQTWPPFLLWLMGPTALSKATRYTAIASLIAFAALDQVQNVFTSQGATESSVTIAQALNPNDSRVYFRRAQLDLAAGNPSAAIAQLESALELNPRNIAALHALGQQRLTHGDIERAQALYSQILEIVPQDLSAIRNLGIIAIHNKDWQQAETLFQRAYELEPESWQNRCFLGQALTERAAYAQAIPLLESTLPSVQEIQDRSGLPRLNLVAPHLATCYQATGRDRDAAALRVLLVQ